MTPVRAPFNSRPEPTAAADPKPQDKKGKSRRASPQASLWALLLARLHALFPLTCPRCGQQMRIIAFVTDTASIRRILAHLGEPTEPPPLV